MGVLKILFIIGIGLFGIKFNFLLYFNFCFVNFLFVIFIVFKFFLLGN